MGKITKSPRAEVQAYRDHDGVEMGVLADGTPFLSSRGLARLCGVAPSAILGWLPSWDPRSNRPRDLKLRGILAESDALEERVTIQALDNGRALNAHPEAVCLAVLEYYAFDAGKEQARNALRTLARRTLREFIYSAVGYDPQKQINESWRKFHARLVLNKLPQGFFSVFREMADLTLSAIQGGLPVDEHTVPDISVGVIWAKFWESIDGDKRFGAREKWPHEYPSGFPQSAALVEAWIYPVHALGEFRAWLQNVYLPEKYPNYLKRKVGQGVLTESTAALLLQSTALPQISSAAVEKQLPS